MHPQADQVTCRCTDSHYKAAGVHTVMTIDLFRTLGMKRFSERARQPTQQEVENKQRLQVAEDKFFNSLKTDRENRIREGKLLLYSDDM